MEGTAYKIDLGQRVEFHKSTAPGDPPLAEKKKKTFRQFSIRSPVGRGKN